MMIEGSGSGSIPLTSGSDPDPGGPKTRGSGGSGSGFGSGSATLVLTGLPNRYAAMQLCAVLRTYLSFKLFSPVDSVSDYLPLNFEFIMSKAPHHPLSSNSNYICMYIKAKYILGHKDGRKTALTGLFGQDA
jgi:hypothetical protein